MHPRLFMSDTKTASMLQTKTSDSLKIMCRDQDIGAAKSKAYDGRWWEWQANRAIAGILLPRKLVTLTVSPFLDSKKFTPILVEQHRIEAEKLVADTFDVNPAVARIRLEEMYPRDEQLTF